MKVNFLDDLKDLIKEFELKSDDICIVGSAVFAYEGVLENGDLDIIIRSKARKKLLEKNIRKIEVLPSGTINIGNIQSAINRYKKIGIEDDEIFSDDYIVQHDSFFVAKPELELAQKIKRGKVKDQLDLKYIGYYFFERPDFDMELFQRLVYTPDVLKRNEISFFKRRKKLKPLVSPVEGECLIHIGALLHRGFNLQGYNRYDIIATCYLLSNEQDEAGTEELRTQIIDKRKMLLAANNFRKRKNDCFEEIVLNESGEPEYGALDICRAICSHDYYVKVKIKSNPEKNDYSKKWLNNYGVNFATEVEKYKESIFREYGVYFCAIIWGAAISFADKIKSDIVEKFRIIDRIRIEFEEEDYNHFIKEIYEIDNIEAWKIAVKMEQLKKYEHVIEVFLFEIPCPNFREKRRDGSYLSDEGAKLKKKIREKYKGYIPNYKNDVIIHISDNHRHSAEMIGIIDKYVK